MIPLHHIIILYLHPPCKNPQYMTKDCSEYSLVNISGSIEYVLTVKSLQTNKRTPDKSA